MTYLRSLYACSRVLAAVNEIRSEAVEKSEAESRPIAAGGAPGKTIGFRQAAPLSAVPDMKTWRNNDEPQEVFESAYAEL
jgi:hypothetical protein